MSSKAIGRLFGPDLMRVMAIFLVIVQHLCPSYYDSSALNQLSVNIIVSVTDWCVPILVMISGYFFLDPEKKFSIDHFFRNNVLRICTALVFWSIVYGLMHYLSTPQSWTISSILGPIVWKRLPWYHLWFVYMLLGLYLLVPILRVYVKHATRLNVGYFVLLCFIVSMIEYWNVFFPHLHFSIPQLSGFIGYFVLGHYLSRCTFDKKSILRLYVGALLACVIVIVINVVNQVPPHTYPSFTSPFSMILSAAVFLLCINIRLNSIGLVRFINYLAFLSFGIYLIHDIFIQKMSIISFSNLAVIDVPIKAICVFVLSAFVSAIIHKIPYLNRYIV